MGWRAPPKRRDDNGMAAPKPVPLSVVPLPSGQSGVLLCSRRMNNALVLLTLLAGVSIGLAAPQETARRIVDGQTVDLTPLLRWEKKPKGERPLKAWVKVAGHVTGTNSMGWEVQLHEGDRHGGSGKIVLKNPPAAEAAEFARLEAELKDLEHQRVRLASEASRPLHDRTVRTRRGTKVVRDPNRSEVAGAKSQLAGVDKQINEVNKNLAQYPARGGQYSLDCFALKTERVYNGLPLYDRGVVTR